MTNGQPLTAEELADVQTGRARAREQEAMLREAAVFQSGMAAGAATAAAPAPEPNNGQGDQQQQQEGAPS